MRVPPLLNPQHVLLAVEVVAALRRGPPLRLACHLAGTATDRHRAILLVSAVTVIGVEQLPAATALAPSLSLHLCGLPDPLPAGNTSYRASVNTPITRQQEDGRRSSSSDEGGKKTQRRKQPVQTGQEDAISPRLREFVGTSFTLESLVQMIARRNLRQHLRLIWDRISNVDYCQFIPEPAWATYLWHSEKGELQTRKPGRPQSWAALRQTAARRDTAGVPRLLTKQPALLLLFLLVYPHRLRPALIRLIDDALGAKL